ncbi:carboxylesterase, partial [Klenkia terrae]
VGLPLLSTDKAAWRGAPLITGADRADVERQGRGQELRRVRGEHARTREVTPQDVPDFLRTRRVSACR